MMEVLVAVVACLLVLLILWGLRGTGKKPPGPWGLPIVGYLPFLGKKPYLELERLGKKYGSVFSIRLRSEYIVVLNDYQSTKEAFAQDALIGRPPSFSRHMHEVTRETGAFTGLPWKEQRRFVLHSLRDLGVGKTKIVEQIQEEIEELLKYFEQNVGNPFCIRDVIAPSMSNNIASLVFGRRFKYDDPIRQMLTRAVNQRATASAQISWLMFFTWIKNLLKLLRIGQVNKVSEISKQFMDFIMQEIEEHERTLNPECIRDLIDGYLLETKKRTDDPAFNKYVLHDIIPVYFSAGSETVRLSIEWLVIAVADHQDAQRRIQTEINEVIGQERPAIWSDHQKMPYTSAFLMEMQRWRTLVPLNVMRYSLDDTEVNGFFIPKHTQILANLWAIHHDTNYWGEDADEFRPERFLTEDGKTVKKLDHYIPFSVGKRSCPGESLARVEVFLYFVSIMQKFNIRFPDGKLANYDSDLGVGLIPKAQDIILTTRK